jgi:hypothetical protein
MLSGEDDSITSEELESAMIVHLPPQLHDYIG